LRRRATCSPGAQHGDISAAFATARSRRSSGRSRIPEALRISVGKQKDPMKTAITKLIAALALAASSTAGAVPHFYTFTSTDTDWSGSLEVDRGESFSRVSLTSNISNWNFTDRQFQSGWEFDVDSFSGFIDPQYQIFSLHSSGGVLTVDEVYDGSLFRRYRATLVPVSVEVSAVPEPEIFALLLAGLGALGVFVRRRTRAAEES